MDLDYNKYALITFFALIKTFDVVDHKLLSKKCSLKTEKSTKFRNRVKSFLFENNCKATMNSRLVGLVYIK